MRGLGSAGIMALLSNPDPNPNSVAQAVALLLTLTLTLTTDPDPDPNPNPNPNQAVALLDELEGQLNLDTQRVYATGISNGGDFLYEPPPTL